MQINSRTLVLSAGWLLAIAIGFLIGRQTGQTDTAASPVNAPSGPPSAFARGGAADETRSATAAKRSNEAPLPPSRRKSSERTIAA